MSWSNNGTAHRPVVMGKRGMVASAHPLASVAGLRALMAGGNAIDAAIATAAALNVVEPYMSGLGGGGYMMIHLADGETIVLDYSGRASENARLEELDQPSIDVGPKSPIVPGAPAGWLAALERYGTMKPEDVFAPAVEYAEQGVPLTILNASFYANGADRMNDAARAVYQPTGSSPQPGAIIRQPALAKTMRNLVSEGPDLFYNGPLSKKIISALQAEGGFMTESDLSTYKIAWSSPLSACYRGYELRSVGAPATAFQVPATLKILEGFDLCNSGQNTIETIHLMAEAMKLAVVDRIEWAGRADAPFGGLFAEGYAESRRTLIDRKAAQPVEGERFTRPLPTNAVRPGSPQDFVQENTTHFDVIDEAGNAVSITQSLGSFFGSGVMAGDTGILLNNFSHFYDLYPESANAIGPSKPRMTSMAPTVVLRDGALFLLIGTPGAFGILETTVQMISNVIDHGYSIQAAIEAPRFRTFSGTELAIESRISQDILDGLEARGHALRILDPWSPVVGGGQGILIDPESGAYQGGADPRRDGYAIGW